jgi:hypothetical protein
MMGVGLEIILIVSLVATASFSAVMIWYTKRIIQRLWHVKTMAEDAQDAVSFYNEKLEELCGYTLYQDEPIIKDLIKRTGDLKEYLEEWRTMAEDVFPLSDDDEQQKLDEGESEYERAE